MQRIGFNLTYIKDRDHWNESDELRPKLLALGQTMMMTGVHRLFTKEDVFEWAYRLILVLKDKPVIEDYFVNDRLFAFDYKNLHYYFTNEDLVDLVGYEYINAKENYIERNDWEGKRNQMFRNTLWIAALEDSVTLLTEKDIETSDDGNSITMKAPEHLTEQLNLEDKKNAELVASKIVEEIEEVHFSRIVERFPLKFKELELRNLAHEIPDFQFENLDKEKQEALWKHWWPNLEHFNAEDQRKNIGSLCRLAYYWANGFVTDSYGNRENLSGPDINFDERISLDVKDYELDDDGINLEITFDDNELGEIFPLLYDPEIEKMSEKPWEKLYENQ